MLIRQLSNFVEPPLSSPFSPLPPMWRNRITALEPWQKTLYIVFFSQLMSVVGFSTIFPFLPLYVKHLGARSSLSVEFLAGLVFSAQAFTMMLAAPLWGGVADRYGRKMMIQRATFGGAIVVLLMGLADSAETLILLRAVQGLITGTIPAANALIAATAPRERMGYALGFINVAQWSGVAIGPLLGGILADAFGYRASFVITGALLLIAGILVRWGVHEQFQPVVRQKQGAKGLWADWRHIFGTKGVSITYGLRFMGALGNSLMLPVLPLFVVLVLPAGALALANTYTGLVVGIAGAASTVTAIWLGRLGDRIGHRTILITSAFVACVAYLPQSLVTAAWQLLLLRALSGAALGGIITSISALLATLTTPGEEGTVYGLDSSLNAASRTIAPLLGASIALWFGLRSVFVFSGLLYLLIALTTLWYLPKTKGYEEVQIVNSEL